MRIAFGIHDLSFGGAERRCVMLANALAERGHDLLVLCRSEPGPLAAELQPAVERCCVRAERRPSRLAPWRYGRVLARFRPEIYLEFGSAYLLPIVARTTSAAILISFGFDFEHQRDMLPDGYLETIRSTFGLVDQALANSQRVAHSFRDLLGCDPDRVAVVANFIDAAAVPCRDERQRDEVRARLGLAESFAFGTVARLVPFKGHRYLLEAAAQLAPAHPEAHWILIGDGPDREALEHRAGELDITERVRFLGSRDDVLRLLQGLDCFVLPSLAEGMPNALLEGMATGLPAIGTAVSGTEEIIEPGRSGWLVEPASAPSLATAMAHALADPARAAKLGEGARQRIETAFDLPVAVDRYLALFEQALARRTTA